MLDEDIIEDFDVVIKSDLDENTTVITSMEEISKRMLSSALNKYDPTNQIYSAYLKDNPDNGQKITPELLDDLAKNPQSDLKKILQINTIIRNYINKDDIIGKTVESIETNVNTEIKLSYGNVVSGRNKIKKLEEIKDFINDFNDQVNLKGLIRQSIPTTYSEGTYIMYLRHKPTGEYIIDYYPLGVCEIEEYNLNGEPMILFNIQELRSKLSKTYKKNKKNKALSFSKIEEEVKACYPEEVYDAFIAKEKYAVLDYRYAKVLRVGNLNRRYGLSPIFRALKPTLMLETFEEADRVTSKSKAKKIIHQKLRKEVMGTDYSKKGFDEMAYAHDNFMQAWKQPTVVVTTPAQVENISYVESKTELTDINTVNNYRSKVLNTLGIGFLMDSSSQSVSTAGISVDQLLRTINKISEQLEEILYKWYKQILIDNGFPVEFAPKITIIDSEALEFKLRKELATTVYTLFNGSLETSLGILGINVNDEKMKREKENEEGLDKIFFPRNTAYTSSGEGAIIDNNGAGRPKTDDKTNKTEYDDEYNKTRE